MDDSHYFRPTSIGHPIPEIRLFQTLTLKLQGQGRECGQRQGHKSAQYPINSLLFHINHTNNSWDTSISQFLLETSKVKVMSEVKGQVHILYPVSNRCTSFSFHIIGTDHSWDTTKLVFDIEKTHPKFAKITVSDCYSPPIYSPLSVSTHH